MVSKTEKLLPQTIWKRTEGKWVVPIVLREVITEWAIGEVDERDDTLIDNVEEVYM